MAVRLDSSPPPARRPHPPRRRRRARPLANVPPYLDPGEIAAACAPSWSRKRVTTELRNAGLLREKRGGRWRVSASELESRLKELYDRVYDYYAVHVGMAAYGGPRRPTAA
jgi:hypothetical protein